MCVYLNPEYNYPIAIVNVIPPSQSPSSSLKQTETAMKEIILKDLITIGKAGGLKGGELIGGMIIDLEEWTPQNGYLVT